MARGFVERYLEFELTPTNGTPITWLTLLASASTGPRAAFASWGAARQCHCNKRRLKYTAIIRMSWSIVPVYAKLASESKCMDSIASVRS